MKEQYQKAIEDIVFEKAGEVSKIYLGSSDEIKEYIEIIMQNDYVWYHSSPERLKEMLNLIRENKYTKEELTNIIVKQRTERMKKKEYYTNCTPEERDLIVKILFINPTIKCQELQALVESIKLARKHNDKSYNNSIITKLINTSKIKENINQDLISKTTIDESIQALINSKKKK